MRNNYRIENDKVYIHIKSNGKPIEAITDQIHLERLLKFDVRWYSYHRDCGNNYVVAFLESKGKRETVYLHRFITNAPNGYVVDHFNHNGLDNTDDNLRVCTPSENQQNLKSAKKNSNSGIKGVSWCKQTKKWRAVIMVNRKQISLGRYESKLDAIKARRDGELKYFSHLAS